MKIKALFCDFDGVFTDNNVWVDENGKESVRCNRSDGIGISNLQKRKIYFCIISSEIVPLAKFRAAKLGIDCFTNVKSKYDLIISIQKKMSLLKTECAFLEILNSADLILKKDGGNGAVREACEYILKSNNLKSNKEIE